MATVLVVEDDKLSQRILSKILNGAQHTALLTASVEDAWTALRQHVAVDLVILDNQLGKNWGWRFLEDLRQDVLFRELPVVIYTGHTERSSILRYVELGVTSMLVKPYKAETVYDEVSKAEKQNWAGRLLENPKVACERLRVKEADYYSVLSAGSSALEKTLDEMRRAIVGARGAPTVVDVLQQLYNQSMTLGMPALRTTTDALAKAIAQQDAKLTKNCLMGIEALRTLLRNRALAYVGIGEITTPTATASPNTSTRAQLGADGFAESGEAYFQRRLASISVVKLGQKLGRLTQNRLFTEGEWGEMSETLVARTPLRQMIEASRYINEECNSASMEELEKAIKSIPGFDKVFLEIVNRLASRTEADDREPDLSAAINRVGLHKSVVLIAAAKLAPTLRLETPFDSETLRVQTLCSLLLSYDIGRMLRLPEEPVAGAAGALHRIGTWAFLVQEPGLYALSVAVAAGEKRDSPGVEKQIFGVSHLELGGRLATQAGLPGPLHAAAQHYNDPSAAANAAHRPTLVCVNLADELAWTIAAQQESLTKTLQSSLLEPKNPNWTVLAATGTELPMDLPEFTDVLITAAKTALWITSLLLPLQEG